jgi:hypothetical protein
VLFRQRPPGSYDALRFRRLGFGRRVWLRHAIPEFRVWRSPRGFLLAYRDVMWQYFEYFSDAAVARAASGAGKADIWRAIWGAFRTFPFRATLHMIGPRPLRKALFTALAPRGSAKPASSL